MIVEAMAASDVTTAHYKTAATVLIATTVNCVNRDSIFSSTIILSIDAFWTKVANLPTQTTQTTEVTINS